MRGRQWGGFFLVMRVGGGPVATVTLLAFPHVGKFVRPSIDHWPRFSLIPTDLMLLLSATPSPARSPSTQKGRVRGFCIG